ncbi:hypothetical protein [Cereibacter sphaeroides]|uniref:hypothetical protein n=1 Tax=Cereibacter sphaeroides TaxID=1063 RepID=UPI001F3C9FB4|nr:hypothetical protein [Cereibacter sphaeroides]MCE6967285.1 hypothetical protein [Cereibacter sphaeroides]
MNNTLADRAIDFFLLLIPPALALGLALAHGWAVYEIAGDLGKLTELPRPQRMGYPFVSERPVLYIGYLFLTVAFLATMALASQLPTGRVGKLLLGLAFITHAATIGLVTLLAGLGLIATLFVLGTSLGQVLFIGTGISWLAVWLANQ